VKDLSSGKIDKVLPGYAMESYSVSRDGKEVAFAASDPAGRSSLWVAPTNRRTSPVRISSAEIEDSPHFLPNGDLIFRAVENGSNFLYQMKADGSERRKITPERILDAYTVSPDGRWIIASTPNLVPDAERTTVIKAFSLDGKQAVLVCQLYCSFDWDMAGKFAYVFFSTLSETSYALPVTRDSGLPNLPPNGLSRLEDITTAKQTTGIPNYVESMLSPSVYAFVRQNTRRNLYRVQLQ
jgi:hypothetical protein